jgi:hypothetical protein
MPSLYGSYDYLPEDGSYVLMVGFDNDAKQLTPIGVGQAQMSRYAESRRKQGQPKNVA